MTAGQIVREMLADERGATAIEYGLIAALVVVASLAGITSFATANEQTYETLEAEIAPAG